MITTVVGSPEPSAIVSWGPLPVQLNWPAGRAFVPGDGLCRAGANENTMLFAELP